MTGTLARGLAIWLAVACAARGAAELQNDAHRWTDASGKFRVEAEFLRAEYSPQKKTVYAYIRSSYRAAAWTTKSWDWGTISTACIKAANGNARRMWSSSRRWEMTSCRLCRFAIKSLLPKADRPPFTSRSGRV